ncbi:hypothetical protein Glove_203g55 [Diversispora epigaea]|uniref:F-box domain-containing protein n=1 Tax=Diversispora epigaea TaxID=1348612 RepID=A0A397IJM0_9GLOM|nr:hypothetical protein Glove_203g55 [Diversispora epigaea]
MAPYLPPECLHNIFINAQDDRKLLFSSLFVSRDWCASVVPILWKKPFNLAALMSRLTSDDPGLVIRTYISCLQKSDKELLRFQYDDLLPSFDYPSFIRELDFEELYYEISKWISTNFIAKNIDKKISKNSNISDNFDQRKFTLTKMILKLIFEKCPSFDYLYLDVGRLSNNFINILIELCEQINPICLQRLGFLDYRGVMNNTTKPEYDILNSLSKICKEIMCMKIRSFSAPTSDSIISLIQGQRNLQKISLWECNLYDMSEVMNAFASQAKNLKEVNIFHCSFEYCEPLHGLAKCQNLTKLSIRQCDHVTSTLLYPIALVNYPHIKQLELYDFNPSLTFMNAEEIPTEQVQAIIMNCNKSIRHLITNLNHDQYFGIIETIATNCIYLTTLELNLQREEQIPKFFPILRSCTKLKKLTIHPLGFVSNFIRVSENSIQLFVPNLPSEITYLDIERWILSAKSLDILLNHLGPNLKFISWGFADISPSVVSKEIWFSGIISDYIKKHSKNIKRFGAFDFYSHDGINDGRVFLNFW